MKAVWNNVIIAESEDTIVVETNHYFPPDSIHSEYFMPNNNTSVCGWKCTANYYTITVNGKTNEDAAWYYSNPLDAATHIKGRVAFWRGVKIVP